MQPTSWLVVELLWQHPMGVDHIDPVSTNQPHHFVKLRGHERADECPPLRIVTQIWQNPATVGQGFRPIGPVAETVNADAIHHFLLSRPCEVRRQDVDLVAPFRESGWTGP